MPLRVTLYRLNDEELDRALRYARWRLILQRVRVLRPVGFALQAIVMMFSLLSIMPVHPMMMPVSVGGGLSFALLWRAR